MTVHEILQGLSRLRALVVGDICLDRWCTYQLALSHASRETGLPRIAVTSFDCTPGAGGTIANNLAAFGLARIAVLGAAGDDGHGYELARALERNGIESNGLIRSPEICTFTYSKLINAQTGIEDSPRVDFVQDGPLPLSLESQIVDTLLGWYSEFDVIFAADQAETSAGGCVTERVRFALAEIGKRHPHKIVWVDSRVRSELFRHVSLKINNAEAGDACTRAFGSVDYKRLRQHILGPRLFVTDGPNRTYVDDQGTIAWVPARRIENPVDICGAGDSFSSGTACALALGMTAMDAAQFGNLIASITVMKRGTGTATPPEIMQAANISSAADVS
jgi:bifunctional ADP-heptose synthase (sugar kinase/adenylyltransferase)